MIELTKIILSLTGQRPQERKEYQDKSDDFKNIFEAELKKRGEKDRKRNGTNEHI